MSVLVIGATGFIGPRLIRRLVARREAARRGGVKRVVYASSMAVSGQQSHFGDRLVNEDDPTHGTSQYAMHKIFNEFQARKYIKNYGMSITGVRPANVTGPDKVRGSV